MRALERRSTGSGRPDRPAPYRARVRWWAPTTKRRQSLSEGKNSEEEAQEWLQTIVHAAQTGLNPSTATMTLAEYDEANMDFAPGGLTDKGTKGKRARKVPGIEGIRPLVAQRILSVGPDPDARLFTGPRGGRISTAVLRDATHWDNVVIKLGYEHLRRHDLRHTGLTWFTDAGVPVHVRRRIAGHGSLMTTQRYLHPDVHKITAAGAALSAHLSAVRAPRSLPSPIVMTR
ncbi:tyrosine-type recombinase/integrase [Streptomyces lavenduligriseus]|nr:tyrosine-type recombinase/integrase [Streptomyces lavenduligriseus]